MDITKLKRKIDALELYTLSIENQKKESVKIYVEVLIKLNKIYNLKKFGVSFCLLNSLEGVSSLKIKPGIKIMFYYNIFDIEIVEVCGKNVIKKVEKVLSKLEDVISADYKKIK